MDPDEVRADLGLEPFSAGSPLPEELDAWSWWERATGISELTRIRAAVRGTNQEWCDLIRASSTRGSDPVDPARLAEAGVRVRAAQAHEREYRARRREAELRRRLGAERAEKWLRRTK